ncbi:MAG TPA: PAS domain S-box protein [Ktedonobacterales bacterium]
MNSQHDAALTSNEADSLQDSAASQGDVAIDRESYSRATRQDDSGQAALFRATFEKSPIGMAHTRVTGEFVRANAALCAMLGYSEPELLSMTFQEITHPEDLAETAMYCERILNGEIPGATFEKRYIRSDGAVIWANLSVSATFDSAGQPEYYLCVIEDITAQKRAAAEYAATATRERAARLQSERNEAHLQAVLDVLPVGVYIASEDGSVNAWNRAGRALWGEDAPSVLGMSDYGQYEAVWADTGTPIAPEERATTRALTTGMVIRDEEIIIRAHDGQERTLLNSAGPIRGADGRIIGAVVTQVDITERKRLERESAARAAELRAVFDAMTEGVVVYDADGSVRHENVTSRELFAMIGSDDAAVTGSSLAERMPRYDVRDTQGRPLPHEQWPVNRVLRGETLSGDDLAEAMVMVAPDRALTFTYSGAPLFGPRGEPSGAILVARDVTQQREREREREQMLGLVSHELKTPLTSIKTLAQLAGRRLRQASRPEAEMLQRMERSVENMTRLVNDLLDATRLETGKLTLMRERCDLRSLCEQVAADQEVATGRPVTLEAPETPIEVYADETRLSQVLTNLLSNALKYSPSDRPVTLRLLRDKTHARMLVADEGPGIPAEALPHLFQRFYRVPGIAVQHGSGVGLGLGLYICRRLVEMHDGQLTVESVPGIGTTFEAILPLSH